MEQQAKVLEMKDIVKQYMLGETAFKVLHEVSLTVNAGEFVSILGPSGSGKTTLMNIIGCLDKATSGHYKLNGRLVDKLKEVELAKIRNRQIGFVFQQFQLLQRLSAQENVELPLIYSQVPHAERSSRAKKMLEVVGLGDKLNNMPNQLSGGQQQRVAIARALVTQPSILLADEPTGALDSKTGAQIMELFKKLNDNGITIIMITHDQKIAWQAKRVVKILDGVLSEVDGDEGVVVSQDSLEPTNRSYKNICQIDLFGNEVAVSGDNSDKQEVKSVETSEAQDV